MQSAYRSLHSTETTLLKVQNDVFSALNEDSAVVSFMRRKRIIYRTIWFSIKSLYWIHLCYACRSFIEMDNNHIPINIYLDLSKAFDTLDYAILIKKLNIYGISGRALLLLHSYLSNRKQYVSHGREKSCLQLFKTWVPYMGH